ncbi:MAG: putative nucleotidyltransferase [Halonotius sp. J07HN6]|nr:MAG: putative nucleotidyltransferase [Halonotius sp. J07HN6]ERH07888.1 MAG: putative nucleotidyltransferase [Halonotius sp. J07HN4]
MTRQNETGTQPDQATIGVPIPPPDGDLFRHSATAPLLTVLFDNPYEQFTIRELGRITDTAPQSVKRAVDVLDANGLLVSEPDGNRRLISINRSRLDDPDEPVLRVPQPKFHQPVRTAVDELTSEIASITGILLFGSVARGDADRQSDIDLWVLATERGHQHTANEIARDLGQRRFAGDRYEFQILVETPDSARGQRDQLGDLFAEAITLVESDTLSELKTAVLKHA